MFWFTPHRVEVLEKVNKKFPDLSSVYGVPIFYIVLIVAISLLLGFYGHKINKADINLTMGKLLRNLDERIDEIKQLMWL